MTAGYSFRTRFLVSGSLVLLLTFLATSSYFYRVLSDGILQETQDQVVRELQFTHRMLAREMQFESIEALHDWLVLVGNELNFRITYVADGGAVIADSHVPWNDIGNLDNHAGRPEIMEARTKDMGLSIRYSGSTQEKQLYVARTIEGRGPIPPGILRVSTPFTEIKHLQAQLKVAFRTVFAALLLVALVLIALFIRQIKRPIGELIKAIKAIGDGDYRQRIMGKSADEFYPLAQSINEMAGRFADHVKEISEQQQQLQAVFDGMQEGVMVLNSRGHIQSVNRALAEVISNPSQTIGKRPLEAVMNLELQDACDRIMAGEPAPGKHPLSLQIELESGKIYEVNIVRMVDRNRNLGAILVFHNISELKRLEKVRQDFVANVTHELRTPLTSIKGYTETLLSDSQQDPETLNTFLQVILKNTNHMVKMVDDLLQLARIESKKTVYRAVPINAAEALELAWKECSALARSKKVHLQNQLPPGGLHVLSDLGQLTQVYRNLLENGIKYSHENSTIRVFCRDEGKSVIFGIQDQGQGIPGEYQQRVFERFYRIERHRSSRSGSTGLGLAICKHIIQGYGGRIWLQSPNPDGSEGCTFFFSLPRASFTPHPLQDSEIHGQGSRK